MQLTGKQISEQGIITGHSDEAVQQQGVDLRVKQISEVLHTYGVVPKEGKTVPAVFEPVHVIRTLHKDDAPFYRLQPGYYEVEFMEGCNIPSNCALQLKSRSSLVRCGADVRSGQFDAGFKTDSMGCFLKVEIPIIIDVGARIAQALVYETADVENLYDGQWQGDKQRTNEKNS